MSQDACTLIVAANNGSFACLLSRAPLHSSLFVLLLAAHLVLPFIQSSSSGGSALPLTGICSCSSGGSSRGSTEPLQQTGEAEGEELEAVAVHLLSPEESVKGQRRHWLQQLRWARTKTVLVVSASSNWLHRSPLLLPSDSLRLYLCKVRRGVSRDCQHRVQTALSRSCFKSWTHTIRLRWANEPLREKGKRRAWQSCK